MFRLGEADVRKVLEIVRKGVPEAGLVEGRYSLLPLAEVVGIAREDFRRLRKFRTPASNRSRSRPDRLPSDLRSYSPLPVRELLSSFPDNASSSPYEDDSEVASSDVADRVKQLQCFHLKLPAAEAPELQRRVLRRFNLKLLGGPPPPALGGALRKRWSSTGARSDGSTGWWASSLFGKPVVPSPRPRRTLPWRD